MERAHLEPGEAAMTDQLRTHPREALTSTEAVSRLLAPRAIALVGASNDATKFSGQPLRNLVAAGYPGSIHPVNRRGGEVGGITAFTDVADLPADTDVAMVMVPAASCPDTVRALGAAGVSVAIIAVSGFAEMGTPEGQRLQDELALAGREAGVRLVGPNCNGVYETRVPLPLGYNHTHSMLLQQGSVALVSHSGAMLGGFVPLLEQHGAGLSAFVSCGNEVDLELIDYIDHFIDDEHTRVIALIMDGVDDGPAFRSALARARAAGKPIVALKLGKTASGTSAAQAHSSRLAGAHAAYDAVFAAEDVVAVPTLETLAAAAAVLAGGRAARGPAVVGFSTSGAGSILLADALGHEGVALTDLQPTTVDVMAPIAGFARVMNPFDIGAAGPTTIEDNLKALADDAGTGAMLFYLTPVPVQSWRQALADGVAATASAHPTLPVLVVSPAPIGAEEAGTYAAAGVPVIPSLLDAVATVGALVRAGHRHDRRPAAAPTPSAAVVGRPLSEPASKRYLAARGVVFSDEIVVSDVESACAAGDTVGYPVVLKAAGSGLTHKTENNLVVLDVEDEAALTQAFTDLDHRGRVLDPLGYEGVVVSRFVGPGVEVVLGVMVDPDFGPMIVLGAGGVLTELLDDVAVAPAPLDAAEALDLIRSTRVAQLLAGYRGAPPSDVDALVSLVVKMSAIAVRDAASLQAIDLNPVRVLPDGLGIAVLDALVVEAS
jgi:acyl-CoA synthetase (NDP forming)